MERKGDFHNAIADYTEAISIEFLYHAAYFHRGVCRFEKKEFDLAIADFIGVLAIVGDDAEAFWKRGCAWDRKTK